MYPTSPPRQPPRAVIPRALCTHGDLSPLSFRASDRRHWRGDPYLCEEKSGLPRRFAPRNDKWRRVRRPATAPPARSAVIPRALCTHGDLPPLSFRASDRRHWRGNPYLCAGESGLPRRFAPRSKCPWGTPRNDKWRRVRRPATASPARSTVIPRALCTHGDLPPLSFRASDRRHWRGNPYLCAGESGLPLRSTARC